MISYMKKLSSVSVAILLGVSESALSSKDIPPVEEEVIEHEFKGRKLKYARNKIEWPECVEEKMTVAECQELIDTELGIGHLISNISSESRLPLPNAAVAESAPVNEYYFRFPVPTNYLAQVTGYENDGIVSYGEMWSYIRKGPTDIGPWDCKGLNPVQCCIMVKNDVRHRDSNNNYIDCWVQELAPVPFHKGRQISYCSFEYENGEFVPRDTNMVRMERVFEYTKAELTKLSIELQGFIDAGSVGYNELNVLSNNLHFHARALEHVQKAAADIDAYLHHPNRPGDTFTVDEKMSELFAWTIHALEKFNEAPFEMEHKVVVHGGDDEGTFVMHVPRINTPPGTPECIPV